MRNSAFYGKKRYVEESYILAFIFVQTGKVHPGTFDLCFMVT